MLGNSSTASSPALGFMFDDAAEQFSIIQAKAGTYGDASNGMTLRNAGADAAAKRDAKRQESSDESSDDGLCVWSGPEV